MVPLVAGAGLLAFDAVIYMIAAIQRKHKPAEADRIW
jgi:hypothetical protein